MSDVDPDIHGPVGPQLLGWILDRHAAALEFYARQWCDVPEDVVQEALIGLARQRKPPHDVVAWLYRVVRHGAINASRSARRRKVHESKAGTAEAFGFATAPGDALDARVAAEALAALPAEEREVVTARVWGGLTFQQIARLMDISDSTAHRRYEFALAALRDKLRLPCLKNDSPMN